MIDHTNRAHALLSASSAHRWMECPPSALLEAQFPDTTSEAAKEGTLAHELCEMKLRNYFFTPAYSKRKLNAAIKKLKENDLWQDEMIGHADTYLDYITAAALAFEEAPYVAIEKKVDLTRWIPDGFGTADCILISQNVLHVIDFKYGKGVPVSAEHNPQLVLYALGAYDAYSCLYNRPTETCGRPQSGNFLSLGKRSKYRPISQSVEREGLTRVNPSVGSAERKRNAGHEQRRMYSLPSLQTKSPR